MRNPRNRLGALFALLPLALLACGNNTGTATTTDDMTGTLTVAYSTTYVFDSDDTSVLRAALEDATDIDGELTPRIRSVGSVAHEPAGFSI